MADLESNTEPPFASRSKLLTFLFRELPYVLMLALTLFGAAYASVSQGAMAKYWFAIAPLIGLFCVINRWGSTKNREERIRLIWTQALHWGAVLLAMQLMFIPDVRRMMNADASAIAVVALLALGTFTAGINVNSWRICLVAILLGASVPAIAWLEQSTLLILLVLVALAAVSTPFVWHYAAKPAHSSSE